MCHASWLDGDWHFVEDRVDDGGGVAAAEARFERGDLAMRQDWPGQRLDIVGRDEVAALYGRPRLSRPVQC